MKKPGVLKKPLIMIIDDEQVNIDIVRELLMESGYDVLFALNGKDAIHIMKENIPDLVLLDIVMPEMDGYDLIKILKADETLKKIPIIFVTSLDTEFDEEKGLVLGAVDYITKPISVPILNARIQTHLQLKRFQDDLQKQVNEKTKEIKSLLSSINSILIGVSIKDVVTHWNAAAEKVFKRKAVDVIGKPFHMIQVNWQWERMYSGIADAIFKNEPGIINELGYSLDRDSDDLNRFLDVKITPIKDMNDELIGFLIAAEEITGERFMRIHSAQTLKLEAIGQLASGIVHEIKTPIQYIKSNFSFLKDSFATIVSLINKNKKLINNINKEEVKEIKEFFVTNDFNFFIDEIPLSIDQSLEGIDKVVNIIDSMKKLSHPGKEEKVIYNINKIIEDAVTVSKNEWKYVADLKVELDENLQDISCYPNQLSQVFLNMIVNSVQSIKEKFEGSENCKGMINIKTKGSKKYIDIEISDTGVGMPEVIQNKIFNPFFTTKEIGKGTGQGLAITQAVIQKMHNGNISVSSKPGIGAVFYISIPAIVEKIVFEI